MNALSSRRFISISATSDKVHDRSYVAHCFAMFFEDLVNRGINVSQYWIWSDGCAGKYISFNSFSFICKFVFDFNLINFILNVQLYMYMTYNFMK